MNGNETLFDHIFNVVLGLHDVCLNLFVHSLTSHTYQVNVKIESQLRFESDANGFLRFSIDDTFWSIKMEILIEDLSKGAQFFGGVLGLSALFLSFWCHFEFDEDVAIAAVINCSLHGLVESYSNGTKINVHRLDLNHTIASSANDFEGVFLDEVRWGNKWTRFTCSTSLHESRAWIVESNGVFHVIIDIPGINWNINVIIFLLERGESGYDLAFLVGQQICLCWSKPDLILVFLWDLPLVLEGYARLILNKNLLLARDTLVDWWEEELAVVAQFKSWFIAVTHEVDLLYVCRVVIIDALSQEVIIPRALGIEFEADNAKTLSLNEPHVWICSECLRGILEDFIINWSVTSIGDLNCLVDGFIWTAGWESDSVLRGQLHHWDERLRSWWERVSDQSDVQANSWINVFVDGIFIFGLLH